MFMYFLQTTRLGSPVDERPSPAYYKLDPHNIETGFSNSLKGLKLL